jgi:hypothetical protein
MVCRLTIIFAKVFVDHVLNPSIIECNEKCNTTIDLAELEDRFQSRTVVTKIDFAVLALSRTGTLLRSDQFRRNKGWIESGEDQLTISSSSSRSPFAPVAPGEAARGCSSPGMASIDGGEPSSRAFSRGL